MKKVNVNEGDPDNDGDIDSANEPEGRAILPKKKTTPKSPSQKKALSPVMQVIQAVTKAATNPGKKKKAPLPTGPSKANLKTPQSQGRKDKGDGPSAEDDGEA